MCFPNVVNQRLNSHPMTTRLEKKQHGSNYKPNDDNETVATQSNKKYMKF